MKILITNLDSFVLIAYTVAVSLIIIIALARSFNQVKK